MYSMNLFRCARVDPLRYSERRPSSQVQGNSPPIALHLTQTLLIRKLPSTTWYWHCTFTVIRYKMRVRAHTFRYSSVLYDVRIQYCNNFFLHSNVLVFNAQPPVMIVPRLGAPTIPVPAEAILVPLPKSSHGAAGATAPAPAAPTPAAASSAPNANSAAVATVCHNPLYSLNKRKSLLSVFPRQTFSSATLQPGCCICTELTTLLMASLVDNVQIDRGVLLIIWGY